MAWLNCTGDAAQGIREVVTPFVLPKSAVENVRARKAEGVELATLCSPEQFC
jgi:hypothetical protein